MCLAAGLCTLYFLPNIVRVMKSRRMRWAGGGCSTYGKRRDVYRVLVGKPEEKIPFGRLRHRWEDNTKLNLQEVDFGSMDCIELAQDREWWRPQL